MIPMAQYLFSVLADTTDLATAEEMAAIDAFNEQLQAHARPLGLRRRPSVAQHGHRRRRQGRGGGIHRRAVPGVPGGHRRLLDHRRTTPRRRAAAWRPGWK